MVDDNTMKIVKSLGTRLPIKMKFPRNFEREVWKKAMIESKYYMHTC